MAGQPHAMPPYLAGVFALVNTVYVEDGTELLTGPDALGDWLVRRGLVTAGAAEKPTKAEFRLAVDLRTALRALALANNGVPATPADLALAHRCFIRLPLQATPDAGLVPRADAPVLRALGGIVAGYATAVAAGEWARLRRCPADECASIFWDSSPRAARRWCTMRVCGNRAKARSYAQRRAAALT